MLRISFIYRRLAQVLCNSPLSEGIDVSLPELLSLVVHVVGFEHALHVVVTLVMHISLLRMPLDHLTELDVRVPIRRRRVKHDIEQSFSISRLFFLVLAIFSKPEGRRLLAVLDVVEQWIQHRLILFELVHFLMCRQLL